MVRPFEANAVRLRWLLLSAAKAEHLSLWRRMLDDDERRRADRFHFAADREAFTAAHALNRAMHSDVTGKPSAGWRFVEGKYGRPELASHCAADGLQFSISHARGVVACAVAYGPVGVDVESADHVPEFSIADVVFSSEEALLLKSAPPDLQRGLFFRLWTLKEAFIKATGEGLNRPLDSFSFTFDPLRIHFHPGSTGSPPSDDPTEWQFAEYRPSPHQYVALAARHVESKPIQLNVRAAQPEEIA